jgi:hypothetical protein
MGPKLLSLWLAQNALHFLCGEIHFHFHEVQHLRQKWRGDRWSWAGFAVYNPFFSAAR